MGTAGPRPHRGCRPADPHRPRGTDGPGCARLPRPPPITHTRSTVWSPFPRGRSPDRRWSSRSRSRRTRSIATSPPPTATSPSGPRVPGFRPGKAPRQVIDRFVGRGSVLAEAIDHLVQDSYDKALDQTDLIPIDQPAVDIDAASLAEGQAITFTATVPVRPEVEPRCLHRLFVRPRGPGRHGRAGRAGAHRASRAAGDPATDRRARGTEGRHRQREVRRHDRRRALRRRVGGPAAARHRRGPDDRRLGGPADRHGDRCDEGLRQHVPRRLPRRGRCAARRRTSRSSCSTCARRCSPS